MPTVSRGIYKWLFRRSATLEDFADRLNHFWTVGLLLLFAGIISWRQTYRTPINCWMPSHFTAYMSAYASDYCWNSYYIVYPDDYEQAKQYLEEMNITVTVDRLSPIISRDNKPQVGTEHPAQSDNLIKSMITTRTLYQWLPLILCLQALLFKLPNLLMYILHSWSGISFDKIGGLTSGYESLTLQERRTLCRHIGRYIYNWCQQYRSFLPWRQLTFLWAFVKLLYCVNIIVQLSLVDGILAPENTTSYGEVISKNLFNDYAIHWKEADVFPKKIFCEIPITQLQNVQKFLIECNLSGNYFSEFAYMFLWVWLLFVAIITCISYVIWILKTLVPISRKRYITKALLWSDEPGSDLDIDVTPANDITTFCDIIGEDGVMALKLAGSNSSDLMVGGIVHSMWQTQFGNPVTGQTKTRPEQYQVQSEHQTLQMSLIEPTDKP